MKILCLILLIFIRAHFAQELFPLSIIHLNDMHARFEEINIESNTCKDSSSCIGGYARVVTMVKELKDTRPNPIYLNAADNFQGTLWYNIFRWNVTQHFLNFHPADVMTLGNHEADHGIDGLVPFMEKINTPIVSCNIDATLEPKFQSLFTKSLIFDRYEQRVGIVGVTTTMPSGWGNARLLPEIESVRAEVENLVSKGIKIIILLSHCGLSVDREIAKNVADIDIIVGGHSHSYLYSGNNSQGPDIPVADYPTIENNPNGKEVLIVQASAYTKYLGNITLYFNENGEIQDYEGAPIFLAHEIEQDEEILEELKPWKEIIDPIQYEHIGDLKFDLDSYCYQKECGMGSLVADSMVHAFLDYASDGEWTGAALAIQNPGGVRAGLRGGSIIYADLVTTTPFENNLHLVEIPGSTLREAFEFSVSDDDFIQLLQVSGIKVIFDFRKEPMSRIVDLKVLCQACDVPRYEKIDETKYYKVVMPRFIANGGDGFSMIPENTRSNVQGPLDINALSDYIKAISPLNIPPLLGRLTIL